MFMFISKLSRSGFPTALIALSGMGILLMSPVPTLAQTAEAEGVETNLESPENSERLKPTSEKAPPRSQSVEEMSSTEEVTEESSLKKEPTANLEEAGDKNDKPVKDMMAPDEVDEQQEAL
ncbi:hypothetical protein [Crocosphaera watsonii]|nr:hypothetical protein [Crocosphaera watsonii]